MATVTFQKDGADVVDMSLTPADFTNGMWHTDEVTTQNLERVTVNAVYANLNPDGATTSVDYRLQAVLEGKEDDGSWSALVRQFNPMFTSGNALTRRLIATSRPTAYDPDFAHIIPDALGNEAVEITVADIDIPSKIRVCMVLADRDSGNADLTDFTLSLTGQLV